jgi:hypothetical protein
VWLRFLYCQRHDRLPPVLYYSPRRWDPRIPQGYKPATSEAVGWALTQASVTASPRLASLRPCSSDARVSSTGTTPPPMQIRPCHYIFSQAIQLPQPYSLFFLFIGEGGAPPWPMGSDCLLPCARDSPLLWVIVLECLIPFPYLSSFHWIVLNVTTSFLYIYCELVHFWTKSRKMKRQSSTSLHLEWPGTLILWSSAIGSLLPK